MTSLRSRRSLLVAALLVGQLVCLLAALAWFGRWLEHGLADIVRERILDASRQIAVQFGRTIDLINIRGLPLSGEEFDRLQTLVEETRLPNGGQLVVVDADTGQVLAHPRLRTDLDAASIDYAHVLRARPALAGGDQAWTRTPNNEYVLAARELPNLGAVLLLIQPGEPMREVVTHFLARLRIIGLIVVVVLVAFSALLSFLIIHSYEDRLAAVNKSLEDLVDRRSQALMRSREGAIFGLAKLAEARDGETGEHLDRISQYVHLLARQVARGHPDLDARWVRSMAVASSLHDIGKVGIPDAVLRKPGPLTEQERQIVQKHPAIGGETLAEIQARWGDDPFLAIASQICAGHHERWDGAGYPYGLSGVKIPLPARIVALADVYDALTSRRAYKEPLTHEDARRFIVNESGRHFDPAIVEAFLAVEAEFRNLAANGSAAAPAPAAPAPDAPADATPIPSTAQA